MTTASAAPARDSATPFKAAKILVTGGFGLIGSALTRRLVAAGSQVCVLDNLDPDSGANRKNLEGLEGRIDDERAGWKGRGIWITSGDRTPWHKEGGKGTKPLVVHFQVRPSPLAD